YEKAFDISSQCLKYSLSLKDTYYIRSTCLRLSYLYMNADDFESSTYYLREAAKYLKPDSLMRRFPTRLYYLHLGEYYYIKKEYDSAMYCIKTASGGFPTAITYKIRFARIYNARKRFKEALPLLLSALELSRQQNFLNDEMFASLHLGNTYLGLKNYSFALKY